MPIPVENCSSALINLLKDRFEISDSIDEAGNLTDDPAKIKVFSFNFMAKNGEDKGSIVMSLLDDNESNNSVKIYFGQELSEATPEIRNEWYQFLKSIRQFAKMHLLGFDVRNINKSHITRRDVEKDLILVKEDLIPMFEGSFGPIDGTVKTSQQRLEDSNIRIVIKHSDRVDPNIRYGRSRKIEKIYLVNGKGERFLMPFPSLLFARAMARHIEAGGTPYDNVGGSMCQLMDEMKVISRFIKFVKSHISPDNPKQQEAVEASRERYREIKKQLSRLTSKDGYNKFHSSVPVDEPIVDNEIQEDIFDNVELDDENKDALPYIYRAYDKFKKVPEEGEFEKWVNAAKGQGEGQDIIMDAGVELECEDNDHHFDDNGICKFCGKHMNDIYQSDDFYENKQQILKGKRAGQRDLQLLKKQKEEAEDYQPFEYGNMNGSIPTRDEVSSMGGQMNLESEMSRFKKIIENTYNGGLANHDFKTGDKVYHKNLKLKGVVIEPPFLGNQVESVLVSFDNDGYQDDMEVSAHLLVKLNESLLKNNHIPSEESEHDYEHKHTYRKSEGDPHLRICDECGDEYYTKEDDLDESTENNYTPCEEYGHRFDLDGEDTSQCIDCGAPNYDFEEKVDERIWEPVFDKDGNTSETHKEFIKSENVQESTLNELFGLISRNEKTHEDILIMEKLMKELGFECIENRPDKQIWKKSYFSIMFGQAENKKLEWVITRNDKFKDRGFGSRSFFKAFFIYNPEFHEELHRIYGNINEQVVESTLNELFGFGKNDPEKVKELAQKEFDSMINLLTFLGFESIHIFKDLSSLWENRYYNVFVSPLWTKKGKFDLAWVITRNKKKIATGSGIVSFGKEILNHEEFRDHKTKFMNIMKGPSNSKQLSAIESNNGKTTSLIDDLLNEYHTSSLTEADVPSSSGWSGPLTWPHVYLGSKFRKPSEIKKYQNTTGKLSPFSLLSTAEKDTDEDGEEVPSAQPMGVRSIALPNNQSGIDSMSQW